ncbi:hypothetical protein OEW28_01595 [Defluviimonas sp. WL0002]|uniref:Uncharacterized protein n=1 Tax=Albidovulum marisflavi TaxID=2984159 RepID=A0ABT2Z847_9RHOB|nr:hypothetical protein [Defluviimonas sp. WL0002]MCV2867320.1 hypothetical protein [Defluviimonas sp. WL0002]
MDKYSDLPTTLTAPAREAAAIVPSDAADLASLPRAMFVGSAGDLAVVMAGGQSAMFRNVAAGSLLPIRVSRVLQTGTTAGDIVGLW